MIIPKPFSRPGKQFLSVLLLACSCWSVLAQPSLDFVTGKALFERNWVPAPASTTASDGLGPLYNARSCHQCHPDGGRGSREQSLILHTADPVYGRQLQKFSLPGVPREAQVTYEFSRTGESAPRISITNPGYGELGDPAVSARLAPPLQGLAELAGIPDSVIVGLADPDDRDGDGISGRVNRLSTDAGNTAIGRFGWKAGQATLPGQIASALSLDLGLGNPLLPAGSGDCSAAQQDCLKAMNGNSAHHDALEANDVVMSLLLAYVQELPAERAAPENARGLSLFSDIGCGDCHLPVLQVDERMLAPYTDLLLHDMGPGLADALTEGAADGNEWRTAPLRALGEPGQFYLHDGRAATLTQAIRWHGGEAAEARELFEALSGQQKDDVIRFLNSL